MVTTKILFLDPKDFCVYRKAYATDGCILAFKDCENMSDSDFITFIKKYESHENHKSLLIE